MAPRTRVHSKVVGYQAVTDDGDVLRHDRACVIAGSAERMRRYLDTLPAAEKARLRTRKVRLEEILGQLEAGAEYAFDEAAFARFQPLALGLNYDIPAELLPGDSGGEVHFLKVRLPGAD